MLKKFVQFFSAASSAAFFNFKMAGIFHHVSSPVSPLLSHAEGNIEDGIHILKADQSIEGAVGIEMCTL